MVSNGGVLRPFGTTDRALARTAHLQPFLCQTDKQWFLAGPRCMKILYIANDRHAAELAAFALRTVAPDVAVAWAASLSEARRWIDENHDVAALIVEVESDNPSCASFVSQVRGLGVTAPVIVVSVKDPAPPLTALKAVADEIVTKGPSFLNDLPDTVRRALHTARPARRRLRLLYAGDAALARECLGRPGGSIEVVEAVPRPGGKFDRFSSTSVLIEHGYPGVDTLAILKGPRSPKTPRSRRDRGRMGRRARGAGAQAGCH